MERPRTLPRPLSDYRLPADMSGILAQRLRRVHERVARTTERRDPGAIAELAVHYDQSGLRDKAYQYALMASEQARLAYADADALDLLQLAERNADSGSALADVRFRMAQVAEIMGGLDEADRLCESALEWMVANVDARRTIAPRRVRERIRSALGQPAQRTLAECTALEAEAKERGVDAERVPLLVMISQAHTRLGGRESAEQAALEGVAIAERLGDVALIADAAVRLGVMRASVDLAESQALFRRALELYTGIGDVRGQARCHNNLGVTHQFRGEWSDAQDQLDCAIAAARIAGMREIWGLAALNSGAMALRRAEHERAADRFGEALAIFVTLKDTERHLYAVYNLAHVERECLDNDAATDLYDIAFAMSRAISQSDVEIGSRAGYGLSLLATGKDLPARVASLETAERLRARPDWFQGRELAEALRMRVLALDGRTADARRRLDDALALAESADPYGAAWLVANCAPLLAGDNSAGLDALVTKHLALARAGGYVTLATRLEAFGLE